jgi:DNA-binding response OmpR family regulator
LSEPTILVVEDEPNIAEIVSLYLSRAGFNPIVMTNGQQALESMQKELPDLAILDVMLPGLDGLSLTRWLRQRSNVPIILMTARGEEVDRISGLEMGADDYVVKPFSPQELISRVKAVLRRTNPIEHELPRKKLQAGTLVVDPITRLVALSGNEVPVTAKEFDLLYLLVQHPRQVFTRDQLLDEIWGMAEYIDPGTVTVHIRRLREKIEKSPSKPEHLQTVWGVGYKFEP